MTFKKTVLVDMDGVLADYSKGWQGVEHIGEPIDGAREFLAALKDIAKVTIFTTRGRADKRNPQTPEELKEIIARWLSRYDMPYDDIWIGQGKPICAAIIDDRAVPCNPQALHLFETVAKSELELWRETEYSCALDQTLELLGLEPTI